MREWQVPQSVPRSHLYIVPSPFATLLLRSPENAPLSRVDALSYLPGMLQVPTYIGTTSYTNQYLYIIVHTYHTYKLRYMSIIYVYIPTIYLRSLICCYSRIGLLNDPEPSEIHGNLRYVYRVPGPSKVSLVPRCRAVVML